MTEKPTPYQIKLNSMLPTNTESGYGENPDHWIETHTGGRFYYDHPEMSDINIEDIAHALANTCRYSGHCKYFYSVAEHSVAVSSLTGDSLDGLLHDASEAYCADIPHDLKACLPEYKVIENRVQAEIARRYGLRYPWRDAIHSADVAQLSTEAYFVLPSKGMDWAWDVYTRGAGRESLPPGVVPQFLSPHKAKESFLSKYRAITGDLRHENLR